MMAADSLIKRLWRSFFNEPPFRGVRARAAIGILVIAALMLGGCATARYRRPDVPVPPIYRGDNSEPGAAASAIFDGRI